MSDQVLRFLLKAVKAGDLEVEDAVRLVQMAAASDAAWQPPVMAMGNGHPSHDAERKTVGSPVVNPCLEYLDGVKDGLG